MQELVFMQEKQAYRYNIDTFLLFDFVRRANVKGRVLDVGCGCGIIGILLKANFTSIALSLLDILKQNCILTQKNLTQNNIKAEVICADFADYKNDEKFDFIVSNPPFYRQGAIESKNKAKKLAKSSKSLNLKSLLDSSNALLKPQGKLYFCYEAGALQELCAVLLEKKFKLTKLVFVHKNQHEKARLLLVEAKKNSKSPCEISSPLFVYENEFLSQKMQEIYKSVKVKSIDL